MARKPLRQQVSDSLDEILSGYPRRGGPRGAPSLREIALATRRRWANGGRRYTATGYFHPADLITPLRVYGMCSFQLGLLESLGGRMDGRRRELRRAARAVNALREADPRAFDHALRSWCADAWENHRRQMAMFQRAATPRGFKGRGPWQFVFQVLWPREAEDFTFRAARELGFPLDSEPLERRYRQIEARHRELIRKAATWYGRNFWRWIERPELFPEEHWWRRVIWEANRGKKRRR
jgi:hypothetical protein